MSFAIVSRLSWHDQEACDLGEAVKEEGVIFVTGNESPNRIGASQHWHAAERAIQNIRWYGNMYRTKGML